MLSCSKLSRIFGLPIFIRWLTRPASIAQMTETNPHYYCKLRKLLTFSTAITAGPTFFLRYVFPILHPDKLAFPLSCCFPCIPDQGLEVFRQILACKVVFTSSLHSLRYGEVSHTSCRKRDQGRRYGSHPGR